MKHVRTDYVRVVNGLRKVLDKIIINNEPALRDRAVKAQYHIAELSKLFYETYSTTSVNQFVILPSYWEYFEFVNQLNEL